MPKDEWGVKRLCPTTGRRFYDLNQNPIISPYTGEVVTLDTGKGSRSSLAVKSTAVKKPDSAELVDDDAELETDDADVVLDDDDDAGDGGDVDMDNELLEDDEEDSVSLEEIADVPDEDDDN
ncbi:MAG: TIGR02300 family protein [Pseudomonadota bacterium]